MNVRAGLLIGLVAAGAFANVDVRSAEQPFDSDRVSLAAYGTYGIVHSSESRADFVRSIAVPTGAGYSQRWSDEPDTLLGAQLDFTISARWSAAVQAAAQQTSDGDFSPHLELARVKFEATSELSFSAGRLTTPIFSYTDSRNIGYAMPWIRTPIELYNLVPLTYTDGANVVWNRRLGEFINTFTLLAGSVKFKYYDVASGRSVETRTKRQFTFSDALEIGSLTFRAGYSQSALTVPASLSSLLDFYRTLGAAGTALAERFDPAGKTNRFYGLGIAYERGPWFATGEWGASTSDSFFGDREGWYASAGYRWRDLTPYLTYSKAIPRGAPPDPGLNAAQYPAQIQPVITQLNAGLSAILDSRPAQATIATGLRWDFAAGFCFKFQYDHIDLRPGDSGTLINVQPGFVPGGAVDVVSIAVNFVL